MSQVVITRHQGLVDYLIDQGIVSNDVSVIAHATPDQITGRDVVGVLPLNLAVLARSVTVIPLDLPQDLRGAHLSKDQVAQYAGQPRRFSVYDRDALDNMAQSKTLDDGGHIALTLDSDCK